MKRDLIAILRDLAKSDYYQSLFSSSKELGFTIFQNTTDLTKVQLWFLSFMSSYATINMDIALGEVSERVLENTVYEDAYLVYKRKKSSKEIKDRKQTVKAPEKESSPKSSWIFKRAK